MSFISNAFGAQNGYNVTAGLGANDKFVNQAPTLQTGINTAGNNYNTANGGLNQLAQMLLQQSSGQGPNIANQQLQNFTGQNVANTAGLIAGQRGASSNPGMVARQIAQQGSGIQQQASGQAAQNVLAQQIAAQNSLGGVLGTQGSLANQNLGINQGALSNQNQLITNANLGASTANAQGAGQNAQTNAGILGGVMNAAGSAMGLFAAEGGEILKESPLRAKLSRPKSKIPEHLMHIARIRYPHMCEGGEMMQEGGPVQAPAPQMKAEQSGDSLKNDKVPAMLSEHEIVLPRSIAMASNAPQLAYDFVSRIKAGHHKAGKRG